MRSVEPKVYLIAETTLIRKNLCKYLHDIGADDWTTDAHSDAEKLCEVAGRLCYRSWKPGLNPNVTRVRQGNSLYLQDAIVKQRHGSVIEHASVSFIFHNVSRVFTHELVRHRVGVAISQESLRYVRLTDLGFWMPSALASDEEVVTRGSIIIQLLEEFQLYLANKFGLDDPGKDFTAKKLVTSAMRRFAPIGLATGLMWTTNFRNLRHVLEVRTALGAEEEIRVVFNAVGLIVKSRYPAIFDDFMPTSEGEWRPGASKI